MLITKTEAMAPGEMIREKRKELGMTQSDLAKIIGTDPATISRWETGSREPTIAAYEKIMKVLGVEIVAFKQ